jgi:hypothetical protein
VTTPLPVAACTARDEKPRSCLARKSAGALVSIFWIAIVPGGEARGARRPMLFPLTFPVSIRFRREPDRSRTNHLTSRD